MTPNSGRLSFVSRQRAKEPNGRLPSGTEVTLAGGSGPAAMALRERTLYLSIGPGRLRATGGNTGDIYAESFRALPRRSSRRCSKSASAWTWTRSAVRFRMTPQNQQALNDGGEVELADGDATARILSPHALPDCRAASGAVYKFSNPWGLALSEDGRNLYLTTVAELPCCGLIRPRAAAETVAIWSASESTPVGPPVVDGGAHQRADLRQFGARQLPQRVPFVGRQRPGG